MITSGVFACEFPASQEIFCVNVLQLKNFWVQIPKTLRDSVREYIIPQEILSMNKLNPRSFWVQIPQIAGLVNTLNPGCFWAQILRTS